MTVPGRGPMAAAAFAAVVLGVLVAGQGPTALGTAPGPTQPVTVARSTAWEQGALLQCAPGVHAVWQPIIGHALRCVGRHVVASPIQSPWGTVSAVGFARGVTLRLACWSPKRIVARVTLHADGHGGWVGPGVWSCPSRPAPPTTVLRAVGA